MTAKEYYKTYQADDNISPLSYQLQVEVSHHAPNHVLEFGCGTGKNLDTLNRLGICTLGIDISPMNVYKAIHKYDLPCIICSDETYLRNLCNIDVVFTCSVLDHIQDIGDIVQEFKRIANRAVIIAETNDTIGEHYYPHDYESFGFIKTNFQWLSPGDGAMYNIWKLEK